MVNIREHTYDIDTFLTVCLCRLSSIDLGEFFGRNKSDSKVFSGSVHKSESYDFLNECNE